MIGPPSHDIVTRQVRAPERTMGEIIPLRSPIDITSDIGRAFVVDATRAGEGVITDQELQERYELSLADLKNIASDKRSVVQLEMSASAECEMVWQ
jgi:hypothetical protein